MVPDLNLFSSNFESRGKIGVLSLLALPGSRSLPLGPKDIHPFPIDAVWRPTPVVPKSSVVAK